MVLKGTSVLSCLLPPRRGFGSNHTHDPPDHDQEKHAKDRRVAHDSLGDAELDPFRGNPLQTHQDADSDPRLGLSRVRANTAPSHLLPSPLIIPNGGIGESPHPAYRSLLPHTRTKRSSFTTFFAFSSKRRSTHGAPIVHLPHLQQELLVPPQAVPGRWVPVSGQAQAHIINPTSIPSPLRADDEEYYYSYCASLTPTSHPASPIPGSSPSKQRSLRQQDLIGNPDLDSQLSSPVDGHPSHTQIRHPYAYSTPLHSKPHPETAGAVPPLRHATSQPLRHHPQHSRSNVNAGIAHSKTSISQLGHEASGSQSHLSQPQLKTSVSTPNLVSGTPPVRLRSLLRKKPSTRPKGQERWLSAETWWDALFSPSPRFRVRQTLRLNPATDSAVNYPASKPVQTETNRNLGVTFPSIPAIRPRAISVTSAFPDHKSAHPELSRSRSAVDLSGQPSTFPNSRTGFEPALETLADEPTPPPGQAPASDSKLPLPDPPLSLEQVLDEGEAFEQQRAQWKKQASKSLGNKHTRSFSRARSKSLGERHARPGHHAAESSKAHLNLEFLTARTLLGSQSIRPVVHVTKPSSPSSHSKAYSHSHSQSAHSYTHSSHSRAYSHSHSHSLTASNSSKSSRNPSRGHFRSGSWGKTALLKAGSLCGFSQDESYTTDAKVPSSSRVDGQGTIHVSESTDTRGVVDVDKVSPSGEVGIAISSSPPPEGCLDFDVFGPRHQGRVQESRWSSRHTHKSSEYAGPHPSAIDSNLPRLGGASDVTLRHRLPPRAVPHPPMVPISHPYRSATAHAEQVDNKGSKSATTWDKIVEGQEAVEPSTGCTPYPHISLSHADFARYGVGEALVYASLPRPGRVSESKRVDVQSESLPPTEFPSPQDQSPSCEAAPLRSEERASSSLAMNSVPSLTNSTIQMVMSAFDNPDDLDEFQDLFYKPHSASVGQPQEANVATNHVPNHVHKSSSSSPLVHLVRKLSEEVKNLRDPLRMPSDLVSIQSSEYQEHSSNQCGTKFVFTDLARSSSSPQPMGSTSQVHLPIQEGSESTTLQPDMIIPEDVSSAYTPSVLESPLEDRDNDTFGFPVKHGQLEATTAPTPIQSSARSSTHLSIQEDEVDEDDTTFLRPVTKRYGVASIEAIRASYVTTSDMSQMSGLSDFPLPPGARPVSILQAHFETTSPSPVSDGHGQSDEATETGHAGRHTDRDVEETLRALRTTPRVPSYESRRSTFGGSDDMDYITEMHQASS